MITNLRHRGRDGIADDTGSLPFAMLFILVGLSLSALLVPVVVNQISSTRTSADRTSALHAAQAGVDVALAHIRVATDDAPVAPDEGNGAEEKLPPCELTGRLDPNDPARPAYRVIISYLDIAGTVLACPPTEVPTTALLISTGTAGAAGAVSNRTIEATYTFRTTNENLSGGSIRLDGTQLCMDAGPVDSPITGTPLTMQTCTAGLSQQQFAYTKDLNLKLIGSERADELFGMCLDAGSPHVAGAPVVFRPCEGPVAHQQWSLNDNSRFQGASLNALREVVLDNFCLDVDSPGVRVLIRVCGGDTFRAEPGVGSGMAGPDTGQLVNYKQFSRCLDVTNFDVNFSYLIVWFCKQSPTGVIPWNQNWTFPEPPEPVPGAVKNVSATGRIRTNGYCLRSPGSTGAGQYVTMTACAATGTLPPLLEWTVYNDTGDYGTSFRILDMFGNCLTPTNLDVAPALRDTHTDGTSKVKVAPCNATELQKWLAPPNLKKPLPLTDITEK